MFRRVSAASGAIGSLVLALCFEAAQGKNSASWRCDYTKNFGDLSGSSIAECNNGYLSHESTLGYYGTGTGCSTDDDSFFTVTQCVCYTFYSGCLCEDNWFEDCNNSGSYTIVYYMQNYLYAFGFLLSAYFSLLQIGHMMLAREKYGNQAQKKHNEERINHDCLAAWRRLAMHVSEQTRQTFMDLMEAACGMDQTVHDNTCCYIESSKQHTNRTLSLKFSVLDNAFVFSLCMGLWCLNPYDLIFDTGDWWWLLFYLGVPHLLWAYEAILLQWLKVNSSAEGGPMSQQSASEKRWQIIRFVPKAIIFCLAFVAAAFENLLYQSSGIPNWCLEGDAAQVKKRLKTERCSKADSFLISVGQMHLTRTTWPFLIYGLFVGAHVVTYFALFASSGRQIEKQLDRSQSGGIGKKMQSKESRNIRTFIRILTAIFTAVSIVFAVFVIYPDVTMRSHIAFWMIWKTSLLAMLYYMYRTVRTPDSKTSHWVSTLFCCGEEVRDSVVETVDLHLNRLENKLRSFSDVVRNSRSGTRSSSALSFNASEESNSGIVLEGTPAGDSDDDEEDRGKGGGLVESSFVKSPLDHGGEEERPKAKGERVSIEMHDIPLTAEDTNIAGANNEVTIDNV